MKFAVQHSIQYEAIIGPPEIRHFFRWWADEFPLLCVYWEGVIVLSGVNSRKKQVDIIENKYQSSLVLLEFEEEK